MESQRFVNVENEIWRSNNGEESLKCQKRKREELSKPPKRQVFEVEAEENDRGELNNGSKQHERNRGESSKSSKGAGKRLISEVEDDDDDGKSSKPKKKDSIHLYGKILW